MAIMKPTIEPIRIGTNVGTVIDIYIPLTPPPPAVLVNARNDAKIDTRSGTTITRMAPINAPMSPTMSVFMRVFRKADPAPEGLWPRR